jgi:hypothetical protein
MWAVLVSMVDPPLGLATTGLGQGLGGEEEAFWIRLDTAAEAISLKSASVAAILTPTTEEEEAGKSGVLPTDVTLAGAADENDGGEIL